MKISDTITILNFLEEAKSDLAMAVLYCYFGCLRTAVYVCVLIVVLFSVI